MPRDGASLDLGTDLAHALDAAMFAEDRLGFTPDPWQADLLRSTAMQIIVNVARQTGKSTTTAIKGLHTAIYDPGLVLLVSPSLRQSRELFGKVIGFLKDLQPAEILEEDNKSSCTLANGSGIVSLPFSALALAHATSRGTGAGSTTQWSAFGRLTRLWTSGHVRRPKTCGYSLGSGAKSCAPAATDRRPA